MHARYAGACAAAVLLTACAGNGEGLDENGRPMGGQEQPLTPEFSSIQSKVFNTYCTQCHSGAAAPLGLRLDEGASYAMLVNTPSAEVPALVRVAPNNPDASYLIQKIEGTAAVGGRMPLNLPPLPADTIAVIRQWIANGAPPSATALSSAAMPATLDAVWPMAGSVVEPGSADIVISSSAELDTTLLAANVITLRTSGGDGDFDNGNEMSLPVAVSVRSLDPTVLAITAAPRELLPEHYELRISGSDPLALADRAATPIDGNRDGQPGGDFIVRFEVGHTR